MASLQKLGKFVQTPDERKRYTFDYSEWLDPGEKIIDATSEIDITTVPPLVVESLTHDDTLATWFVSGGVHGEKYNVVIKITTGVGQIKQDALAFAILDYTP